MAPDVIHGHGSKGGAYARFSRLLPTGAQAIRVYTPHGGSLNHRPGQHGKPRLTCRPNACMARRTDLLLFESAFIAGRYRQIVGEPHGLSRVVHNGIAESEFVPVEAGARCGGLPLRRRIAGRQGHRHPAGCARARRAASSADRPARCWSDRGRTAGPDRPRASLEASTRRFAFRAPFRRRTAFALGRILVVPSRAESLPYVVLEAAGARLPLIATNVGGIPEIFGPYRDRLLPPDDVEGLAAAWRRFCP